jgi:hypothetical protein
MSAPVLRLSLSDASARGSPDLFVPAFLVGNRNALAQGKLVPVNAVRDVLLPAEVDGRITVHNEDFREASLTVTFGPA